MNFDRRVLKAIKTEAYVYLNLFNYTDLFKIRKLKDDSHFIWMFENGYPIPKGWHDDGKQCTRNFIVDFNEESYKKYKGEMQLNSPEYTSGLWYTTYLKDNSTCRQF